MSKERRSVANRPVPPHLYPRAGGARSAPGTTITTGPVAP